MTLTLEKAEIKSSYAISPIVLRIINADVGDYYNGLTPTTQLKENLGNLGVLGTTEPLLSTAIGQITGIRLKQSPEKIFNYKDSKSLNGLQNQMYIEST
jgi:hypothetical protein